MIFPAEAIISNLLQIEKYLVLQGIAYFFQMVQMSPIGPKSRQKINFLTSADMALKVS
jgi:hypothetical protein